MSVKITVTLSEREADAFVKAQSDRGGYHYVSQALEVADFKIVGAIHTVRADRTPINTSTEGQHE